MKIEFPHDEPIALVNHVSKEIKIDKIKSNVVTEHEVSLFRWAKRILKGDYKITYLDGKPNESADRK